jgi:hypothetical protein
MNNDEENKLTYINTDGDQVYTSKYLLNRGSCCKTNCLHCPYGHTLKNFSIKILPIEEKYIKYANEIISDSKPVELSNLTLSILSKGFGKKEKVLDHRVTLENFNNYAFGQFKNDICAVIEFSNKLSESNSGRGIKAIYLKKEFQNQGLGIEHIEK